MTKKNIAIAVCLVVAAATVVEDVKLHLNHAALPEISSLFPRSGSATRSSVTPPADKNQHLPAPGPSEIHELIQTAARKNGVSAAFVRSVVAAESNFDVDAISPKGAIGLMQLMPETAHQYGADPSNPQQNIEAGTKYLKFLMNRYRRSRSPLAHAIAAYNAGPGMVDRYRGVPPFRETRAYVTRVMGYFHQFQRQPRKFGRPSGPELATVLR